MKLINENCAVGKGESI